MQTVKERSFFQSLTDRLQGNGTLEHDILALR